MKLNKLIIFIALFLVGKSFAQTINLKITEEANLIGSKAHYFQDLTSSMTVHDIMNSLDRFETIENDVFSSVAIKGVTWLYFDAKLSENQPKDFWLDLHNSNLTHISFYKVNAANQIIDSIQSGAMVPVKDRIDNNNTFWFPIADKDDHQKYRFFIRAKTRIAVELPLFIGTEMALSKNASKDNLMALFFIGSSLTLMVYNIFFFFYLRKKIYLFYSLNLLGLIIIGPYFNNYPLLENILGANITHNYANLWTWIPLVTGTLFAVEYLNLKKTAPRFRLSLIIIVGLYVGLIPFSLISPSIYQVKIYLLLIIAFYITCLVMGFYLLWVERSKRTLLFCIGWTALVIGIIVMILVRNGIIPYSIYIRNFAYFGLFIESIVFGIGVGQYLNELRNKQLKLNKELLTSNNELINLNDSLDSFNYHVSHDLKTVLNNTKALAKMVSKYTKKEDYDKLIEVAKKMQLATSNGVETVQSFLSLGKIENLFKAGGIDSINIETELSRLIEEHNLSSKIDVKIQNNEIGQIRIHKKAFESIFLNLLTNSIKYSGKTHPRAELSFQDKKEKLTFLYKDYGNGIDMEKYADKIFKPFQRGGASAETEGTGVGLYILNRVVTNYAGTVKLSSELNKGVKVEIDFPIRLKENDTIG